MIKLEVYARLKAIVLKAQAILAPAMLAANRN